MRTDVLLSSQVNREKRQEIEDLHIKHGTVQSGASVAEAKVDKFTRDLADAHKRIEELTNKLSQQDASIRELGDVKSMLAKTPGISKELAVAAQVRFLQNLELQLHSTLAHDVVVMLFSRGWCIDASIFVSIRGWHGYSS